MAERNCRRASGVCRKEFEASPDSGRASSLARAGQVRWGIWICHVLSVPMMSRGSTLLLFEAPQDYTMSSEAPSISEPSLNVLFLVGPESTTSEPKPAWNRQLVDFLRGRGLTCTVTTWGDSSLSASQLATRTHILALTTGHYIDHIEDFRAFLQQRLIPALALNTSLCVFNPPSALLWNSDKIYLAELQTAGFPVPPITFLSAAQPVDYLRFAFAAWPADGPVVIKPSISASGRGVHLVAAPRCLTPDDEAALRECVNRASTGSIMVQEFLPGVTAGELSMYYIGGTCRYAARKLPREGDWRIGVQYEASFEPLEEAHVPANALVVGDKLWSWLCEKFPGTEAGGLAYARIDGVMTKDAKFVLMGEETASCRA